MIKLLESLLNFIVWAVYDIGRAIKHNPLTEAWRKMMVNKAKPHKAIKTYEAMRKEKRERQLRALKRISADIKKHGFVKMDEFGRKQ